MKITKIECFVLLVPDYRADACSSAQDDLVVKIHTDEGLVGIGETDTNPWVARAMIEAPGTHIMGLGLTEMLMGKDPTDVEGLWDKMYTGSAMTGRRGLGICAIGALDMALWDLRGKAEGKPCWQLLGGAVNNAHHALCLAAARMATISRPIRASWWSARSRRSNSASGPRSWRSASKGPTRTIRCRLPTTGNAPRSCAACREAVGPEMTLMVDVAYAWADWKEALRAIDMFADQDIYFIETPLPSDDIEGYAKLVKASPVRVAAGEWLNSRFEFRELMDRDALDVVQPDVGRVGGLTEARRVDHGGAGQGARGGAALLEIGHRHRGFRASGRGVADLHLYRVPAARARGFEPAQGSVQRRAAGGGWPDPAADRAGPRRDHQ